VRLSFSSAAEAVSYTLALGAAAKVIDPPGVRAAVAQTARELVAQYQGM
jgi:predicted DNA-binding transcriptional regulator YafY